MPMSVHEFCHFEFQYAQIEKGFGNQKMSRLLTIRPLLEHPRGAGTRASTSTS